MNTLTACYGCYAPIVSPADDLDNNGVRDSCEPRVNLLFVPLNWDGSQAKFDQAVARQVKFFSQSVPLKDCPQRIKVTILNVTTQNNKQFACSRADCGTDNVRNYVTGLGISVDDYDVIVGVTAWPHCSDNSNIVGCSNLADTIWITSAFESVTAHELGHIYGLSDEYCSNPGGSTDCRCNDGDKASTTCNVAANDGAKTGDRNWLDPALGCDPFGPPCVNAETKCKDVDYNICSLGNKDTAGGQCVMSYADAPGPRAFCQHCVDWLATIGSLRCEAPSLTLNQTIVDITLHITPADGVKDVKMIRTYGRASPDLPAKGSYRVRTLAEGGNVSWQRDFDVYFDYYGSRVLGADYANVSYDAKSVSFRIPSNATDRTVELYHGDKLIYTAPLDFCNGNGVCDTTETYQTCKKDCPLDRKDGVCMAVQDKTCDPDCLAGVDTDCAGHAPGLDPSGSGCARPCRSGSRCRVVPDKKEKGLNHYQFFTSIPARCSRAPAEQIQTFFVRYHEDLHIQSRELCESMRWFSGGTHRLPAGRCQSFFSHDTIVCFLSCGSIILRPFRKCLPGLPGGGLSLNDSSAWDGNYPDTLATSNGFAGLTCNYGNPLSGNTVTVKIDCYKDAGIAQKWYRYLPEGDPLPVPGDGVRVRKSVRRAYQESPGRRPGVLCGTGPKPAYTYKSAYSDWDYALSGQVRGRDRVPHPDRHHHPERGVGHEYEPDTAVYRLFCLVQPGRRAGPAAAGDQRHDQGKPADKGILYGPQRGNQR